MAQRINKLVRMTWGTFPYACTMVIHDEAVYLLYTGKLMAVQPAGGFLQGSVNRELHNNEIRIHENMVDELDALAKRRRSVRIPRSDIVDVTLQKVSKNPWVWSNGVFAPVMTIKTKRRNYAVHLFGHKLADFEPIVAGLKGT
jgi:hypothetical protein